MVLVLKVALIWLLLSLIGSVMWYLTANHYKRRGLEDPNGWKDHY